MKYNNEGNNLNEIRVLRGFITFEPPKIMSFKSFIFMQITKRKAIKIYSLLTNILTL